MEKISKKTIESLREFLNRGCEHGATQETVNDLMDKSLRDMGAEIIQANNVVLVDRDKNTIGTLDAFADIFWDKAVEDMLDVMISLDVLKMREN